MPLPRRTEAKLYFLDTNLIVYALGRSPVTSRNSRISTIG